MGCVQVFMMLFVCVFGSPGVGQVGRNERINYAKGLLQREFLPHVGIGPGTEAKKVH